MLFDTQKIEDLPMALKVELLEMLVNSFHKQESSFDSPLWHDEILATRRQEMEQPEKWRSLNDVKKH